MISLWNSNGLSSMTGSSNSVPTTLISQVASLKNLIYFNVQTKIKNVTDVITQESKLLITEITVVHGAQ